MSSVANPTKSNVPAKSGAPPRGAATEAVRQSLHDHLRKTATFIKILDLLVLVFAWIAGILVLWLAACVIDHWLLPLPSFLRWAFWVVGVAGTGWWTVAYAVPLILRRINLAYAARRIEHLVPDFKKRSDFLA